MQGNDAVLKNPTSSKRLEQRAPLILQMAAVGLDCFDCSYYRARNADLSFQTCWEAWTHFINFGQFDLRPSRCAPSPSLEICAHRLPLYRFSPTYDALESWLTSNYVFS